MVKSISKKSKFSKDSNDPSNKKAKLISSQRDLVIHRISFQLIFTNIFLSDFIAQSRDE